MNDDYSILFPLTEILKQGQLQYFQPAFTREFELIGVDISDAVFWDMLKQRYKFIQFRHHKAYDGIEFEERQCQYLKLNDESKSGYSTNAKRLIKKSNSKFTFKRLDKVDDLLVLVTQELSAKIKAFTPDNIAKLKQLMENAMTAQKGECIGVFEEDEFVGGGFFLTVGKRVTYLKGVAQLDAKKNGAMYGLMNYAIEKYLNKFDLLDFGGSDIKNVADFYKKFGADDRTYYNYEINQLPKWYKLAKKVFKK